VADFVNVVMNLLRDLENGFLHWMSNYAIFLKENGLFNFAISVFNKVGCQSDRQSVKDLVAGDMRISSMSPELLLRLAFPPGGPIRNRCSAAGSIRSLHIMKSAPA
jgi:hypothetical protein